VLPATVILVLSCVLAYGAAIVILRLDSIADIRAWMAASSHNMSSGSGVVRMVFGFARSFINRGNDGMLFKRFLLHDAYNHVSAVELLRLSLWKLLLFYLFLLSLLLSLMATSRGKSFLILFLINAVPVLAFAAYWQGGDMERYLALYPMIFIALAYCLNQKSSGAWLRPLVLLFLLVMAATSVAVMANPFSGISKK
jgi:hypothetical protein